MDQQKRVSSAYLAGADKNTAPSSPTQISVGYIKKKQAELKERNAVESRNDNNKSNSVDSNPDVEAPMRGFLKVGGSEGYRKAAKFLLILGKREAVSVLKHFSTSEVEEITKEIASIKQINKEEAVNLLKDFGYLHPKLINTAGGVEVARNMLTSAFGEEEGSAIFKKVIPFNGEKPFSFLEDLEFQQLMMILRKEPVHVLTVIISFLDKVKASKILESLPPEVQTVLVARMAGMERIAPEVIVAMEEVLIERIRTQGKVITEEIDGQTVLAEILKNMDLSDEGRILDELAAEDKSLSDSVREKLFTVETILFIRDSDLEKILRDFSDTEIAVLLKGRDEELRKKIIYNISRRRIEFIKYEEDALGPMRKGEVDKAMKEFLDYLKDQEIQGNIVLSREKDEYI